MELTGTLHVTGPIFRVSWTAYTQPIGHSLLALLITIGVIQTNLWACAALTVLILAYATYQVLMLRSIQLYTDREGVWVYRGIFPWDQGFIGVKWCDLEHAASYPNYLSWASNSYTVRIGHRFTKSSEIVLRGIKNGQEATAHINDSHRQALMGTADF